MPNNNEVIPGTESPNIESANISKVEISSGLSSGDCPIIFNPQGIINNIQSSSFSGDQEDITLIEQLRAKYKNNPSIGYLNINSLRGDKFSQLEEMCKLSQIDILCIDETKLTPEIPTSRFVMDNYQNPPIRRDRINKSPNSFGGGKLVYIREGVFGKRIKDFETPTSETICIELSLKIKSDSSCLDIDQRV